MYCYYHFCAECARRYIKQESYHPGYSRSGSTPQDLSHHTHLRSQQKAVSICFCGEVAIRHNGMHVYLYLLCYLLTGKIQYIVRSYIYLQPVFGSHLYTSVVAIQVWPSFRSRCSLPRAHLGVWQPVSAQCPRSPAGWCLHHTTHRWTGSFRYISDKH